MPRFDFEGYRERVRTHSDAFPRGPQLTMGTLTARVPISFLNLEDNPAVADLVREIPFEKQPFYCPKCNRQEITLTEEEAGAVRDYLSALLGGPDQRELPTPAELGHIADQIIRAAGEVRSGSTVYVANLRALIISGLGRVAIGLKK